MNEENALELFENQLDLPAERIKRTNDVDRRDFGWGIGYKQSPIAQGQASNRVYVPCSTDSTNLARIVIVSGTQSNAPLFSLQDGIPGVIAS